MNKLILACLAVLVLAASPVLAQQKPQFSQYTLNNYLANPAISGIEDYTDVKFGSRHQWSGLEGAPVTYYTTVHMPLNKDMTTNYGSRKFKDMPKESTTKRTNVYRRVKAHHGIGATAMTTKTGVLKRSSLSFSYAYHQPITRSIRLSAGVAPGLIQYSLDPSRIRAVNMNDPALNDGRANETKFDLNMGFWLYSQNFYVGVAGSQLLPSQREYIITSNSGADQSGALQQHFYTTAGYRINAAPGIAVIPSVMVKMASPSPASVDANMKVMYADRIWAGVSYRHNEAVAAMAGVNVSPLLDVAYSYDAGTSPLRGTNSGSHEVVVGLKLRNAAKVLCPNWAW
ncbi:type IX secretion system membrane protein PorP/SprF [Pontibacter qinzhouensis]|uniref:Type IX secretion system membrane protein PorP/SprF n=1 Tax=Pontibacter qinzhouensis TaxID=2603253 RepID=A0A5C8J989_9BACT|nr:type IX secretion system membrane protein PorP/SprF [Pontibacter qinzhouensis]TXK33851.1 type IX secretion system membrane protein PorP/SprF [Pontibacter qinzhouensis]